MRGPLAQSAERGADNADITLTVDLKFAWAFKKTAQTDSQTGKCFLVKFSLNIPRKNKILLKEDTLLY